MQPRKHDDTKKTNVLFAFSCLPGCSCHGQMPDIPHVVIIGGGFGGLDAARALAGAPVRVTLVDRHNYHLFQPFRVG